MTIAEFEEKTYEKYFGHELAVLTRITFSPGQNLENLIGFDEAFFLGYHYEFWSIFSLRYASGMPLSELNALAKKISRRLPKFHCNFFVQFKRPEYLERNAAKEWSCWRSPYFRYDITQHQQSALIKVKRQAGARAEVVYASPAFWEESVLYGHVEARRVVSESNVVSVAALEGHGRFSYTKAGGKGIAHSEPVEITAEPIEKLIAVGLENDGLSLYDHVISTASHINASLVDDRMSSDKLETVRRLFLRPFFVDDRGLRTGYGYSMATIHAFCEINNVKFFAIG